MTVTPQRPDPNKRYGRWQGKDADSFEDLQYQIRAVLDNELSEEEQHAEWIVELHVKKNPVHDYRIVLSPGS